MQWLIAARPPASWRPPASAAPRLWSLALFVVVACAYLATATHSGLWSIDVLAAAQPAHQLAQHGTLYLDGVAGLRPGLPYVYGEHVVSNRFPGVVLPAVPFYWVLGGEQLTQLPAAVAAALMTAGAVTLVAAAVRPLLGTKGASAVALVLGFATGLWSVAADQLWSHGPAALALAAAMLAMSRSRWWLAGLAFGAAVLVRPHLAAAAVAVGVCLLIAGRRTAAVRLAAGTALGAAAFLCYNRGIYGHWSVLGGYAEGGFGAGGLGPLPFLISLTGGLLSPQRGLLFTNPLLILLLFGLRAGWDQAPLWVRASAGGGVAYTLTQFALNRFNGGTFYGSRLTLELLVLSAPLLALACRDWVFVSRERLRWFVPLLGLSFFLHASGALFFAWAPTRAWTSHDTLFLVSSVSLPGFGAVALGAVLIGVVALRLLTHRPEVLCLGADLDREYWQASACHSSHRAAAGIASLPAEPS